MSAQSEQGEREAIRRCTLVKARWIRWEKSSNCEETCLSRKDRKHTPGPPGYAFSLPSYLYILIQTIIYKYTYTTETCTPCMHQKYLYKHMYIGCIPGVSPSLGIFWPTLPAPKTKLLPLPSPPPLPPSPVRGCEAWGSPVASP